MGQRIRYFKNNNNKEIKDLIAAHYGDFRQWFLDHDQSSIAEFNEPFGNEIFKNYLIQNTDCEAGFEHLDKQLTDELTAEFIGGYCESPEADNNILEFFGPAMSNWRYDLSTQRIIDTEDQEFIRLWNYLIKGRSLKDDAAFVSYSNECKIGFLTFDEHRLVKRKIETYFGNIEKLQKRYWWANKEQNDGLCYVLTALNAMTMDNNELISVIE